MLRPLLLARTLTIATLFVFGLSATQFTDAATLEVPATYGTIQAAIMAAVNGDVVEVGPGTYAEEIDFLGKSITVRSTAGPAMTTITGSSTHPVVHFRSDEDPDAILEGFTIEDGHEPSIDFADGGGGIQIIGGASPTIRGNTIRSNTAHWNGSGIYLVDSMALIEMNQFIDNSFIPIIADAPYGRGAGVCIQGGAPTVRRNIFMNNVGHDSGGGIYVRDAQTAILEDNWIQGNMSGYGGGIGIDGNSLVTASNNLVVNNTAFGHSGFAGPTEGLGGGIYVNGASSVVFYNHTIVGNNTTAGWNGPGTGGGVWVMTLVALPPTFINCILRGNISTASPQVDGFAAVLYSNVEGGLAGTGNIDADPLFVTGPNGDFYLSQIAAGQGADSPCVDAGDPMTTAPPASTTRTDEVADSGIVDIGFHFPTFGGPTFVRGDCNDDGSSNLADVVTVLTFLFPPATPTTLPCDDACDGNDDGTLNISDAVTMLNALFGMPAVPLPAPIGACGSDPTNDALGCASFTSC